MTTNRQQLLDKLLGRGADNAVRTKLQTAGAALDKAGIKRKEMGAGEPSPKPAEEQKAAPTGMDALVDAIMQAVTADGAPEAKRQAVMDLITSYLEMPQPEVAADATDEIGQVEMSKAFKGLVALNADLLKSQEAITADQATLTKGLDDLKSAVSSLKPLVDSVNALPTTVADLATRIKAVEDALNGRPRRATEEAATEIEQKDLPKSVQDGMKLAEFDQFWGVKLPKKAGV